MREQGKEKALKVLVSRFCCVQWGLDPPGRSEEPCGLCWRLVPRGPCLGSFLWGQAWVALTGAAGSRDAGENWKDVSSCITGQNQSFR